MRSNYPPDLTGLRFGSLTVICRDGSISNVSAWKCKCSCGNTKRIRRDHLTRGLTISCGCYNKEQTKNGTKHRIHGFAGTRLYRIWHNMHRRCEDPKRNNYERYGGRGISVCEEWSEFIPFKDWALANGYKDSLSIDRIDNDKGYCPENCRWATAKEQSNNRKPRKDSQGIRHYNPQYALYKGDRLISIGTIRELAELHGVKEQTIRFYACPAHKRRSMHSKAPYTVVRVEP